MILDALTFDADPNREHEQILAARDKAVAGAWEVGARLLHSKETGAWRRVTVGGPFTSFTDYVDRGVGINHRTAFGWMKAAELPRRAVEELGIKGAELLASIVEMTAVEETLEDALSLEVEADDGSMRPFSELSVEEKQRAHARIRMESGKVRRGRAPRVDTEGTRLRDRLREILKGRVKAGQVQTRLVGGQEVIDLEGVPAEEARELCALIAAALRH